MVPPRSADRLDGQFLSQDLGDLADGRVATLSLLGEDQLSVDRHLEDPSTGGDQGEQLHVVSQLVEHRFRQADGLGKVVSHVAVLDRDGELPSLSHQRHLLMVLVAQPLYQEESGVGQGVAATHTYYLCYSYRAGHSYHLCPPSAAMLCPSRALVRGECAYLPLKVRDNERRCFFG